MAQISVDGTIYEWDEMPISIYQFLSKKGIIIPCFCYHEQLKIAGNCRMCLVEANSKMVVSCATPMDADFSIVTSSDLLSHCRESVLEFLLANHPLDCPICDQGGECDLQDISKTFGLDRGRFYETKRSVDNLNCFGPLVKTLMTRCIHCTRCVRFLTEYCDDSTLLGIIGRGASMEIGSFTEFSFIDHPLSANVIDLCPVGALTSMPSAFTARPWECKSIESIDLMDSLASGLRFEVSQDKVIRCLPLLSENLNQDFITNKARFVYFSLGRQEMTKPLYKENGKWVPISWHRASTLFFEKFFFNAMAVSVRTGNFVDLETAALVQSFCDDFCQKDPRPETFTKASAVTPELFLYNSPLSELEETSLVVFIGCNLRQENPLMFLRLRRSYLDRCSSKNPLVVYSIGAGVQYDTVPIIQLGCSVSAVQLLVEGRLNGMKDFFFSGFIGDHLYGRFKPKHARPKVIIGTALFELAEAQEIQHRLWNFCLHWQSMLEADAPLVFNTALDYLGKLSMCAVKSVAESSLRTTRGLVWNFQTETAGRLFEDDFVIYQGYSMPSDIAKSTDLFLPTASPLERSSFYLNVLGMVRQSQVVLSPRATTYTDSQIIRFFFRSGWRFVDKELNREDLTDYYLTWVRLGSRCKDEFPWKGDFAKGFAQKYGIVLEHNWSLPSTKILKNLPICRDMVLEDSLISSSLDNYYSSDVYSRLSPILGNCATRGAHSNFDDLPPSES